MDAEVARITELLAAKVAETKAKMDARVMSLERDARNIKARMRRVEDSLQALREMQQLDDNMRFLSAFTNAKNRLNGYDSNNNKQPAGFMSAMPFTLNYASVAKFQRDADAGASSFENFAVGSM
eukprot:GEZU01022712.1.p4 GENE.GEZU01022712.1~~GEZU01022712.1.p4  ORF type:complete len:124 (+),score=29.99 GEZU01022712.1:330-701(+)